MVDYIKQSYRLLRSPISGTMHDSGNPGIVINETVHDTIGAINYFAAG